MYNYSNKKPGNSRKLFNYNELLKNTVEQAVEKTKQAADKSVSVSEPSWMSKGTKSSSPFGNGNISSDNFTGLLLSDSSASFKKNENKKPQSSGSLIKQRLSKLPSDSTGKDYSKAFDGIDDRLAEKNIPLAEDTVRKNTSKRAYYGDYPNMRDGMALFYAASEANDPKTAKLARLAAYTEDKSGKAKITQNPLLTEDNKKSFPSSSSVDGYGKESQKTKADDNTRYVVGSGVRLRAQPGTSSEILTSMDFGTSVKYTGNKTDMINGYRWAEVEYNGKKGWVADTLLGINDPVEAAKKQAELERQMLERTRYVGKDGISLRSDPHTRSENIEVLKRGDRVDFTGEKIESLNRQWAKIIHNGNIGWVEANDLRLIDPIAYEKAQNLLKDHQALRNSFATVKGASKGIVGDYDDLSSLECVDLSKWFVNEFTTLNCGTGHGKDHVNGVITNNIDKDLRSTIIPCAPAVYSVAAGKPGPELNSNSHSEYGHTGVIIDVKRKYYSNDPYKDKYDVTYFHAWDGCAGFSQINAKEFSPSEDVTYLDLSKYMK